MNDRTLGYLCLIIPVIILSFVIGNALIHKPTPGETRIIEFDGILGLSFIDIQDPVLFQGLKVGAVVLKEPKNDRISVTIRSKHPIKIYKGYSATVGAQGVMGDRFLNIDPGNQTNEEIPTNKPLHGTLLPSPPEAIAKMEELLSAVRELKSISDELLHGSDSKESFISFFHKTLIAFDTTIGVLTKNSTGISDNITALVDTVEILLEKSFNLSNSLYTAAPTMLNNVDTLLASSSLLVDQFNTLLTDSEHMVQLYNEKDFTKLHDFIAKTQSSLCSLQVIIQNIQTNGMYLPVRLW